MSRSRRGISRCTDLLQNQEPQTLPPEPADDSRVLAGELTNAFAEYVRVYRLMHPNDPLPDPPDMDKARCGPPDQVSWHDLDRIARSDPAAARARWEEIKRAAREELHTGHRAARGLGLATEGCWQRAQFLAIRDSLRESWQPRNEVEAHLLDQLAQIEYLRLYWVDAMVIRAESIGMPKHALRRSSEERYAPTVSTSELFDQAASMFERLQRIFLMLVRTLRDLRKQRAVYVGRARQVNLGERQINVGGDNMMPQANGEASKKE